MKTFLILMMISSLGLADCNAKLAACDAYRLKLEEANNLKDEKINILIKQRDEALQIAKDAQPLLPAYMYIIIGVVAGVGLTLTLGGNRQ